MTTIEKIRTDVPGLDTLTYGGIPKRRSTLITGRSGTAKSILAVELACNFARRGIKTLLLSVEETPEDLITTADSLELGLGEHVKNKLVHIIDLTRTTDGPTVYSGEFDIAGLIHTIEAMAKTHGPGALVLDSATALFSPRPSVELMRSLFYQLVSSLRRLELTSVITAEALEDYGSQLTTLGVEDFVCDTVIILRNLIDSERRRRSLEIHKYRRSRHYKGEFPFTITTKGLVVFPLDAQVASAADDGRERFGCGVVGLDEMANGGWLRDSITLVRGPTGSGKTTLAGLYARAGAQRGEKVIYYGFEETKPALMRNFASTGIPLEEFERDGTLRIFCSYPEATSPEDLLVDLRSGLEEHNPALIVFDSISSIEHSTSVRGFRQFMVGLAALLREHGRTALLTQTIVSGNQTDGTAPFLSTIPDAIVLLDYELRDESLVRSVRVLKMRGSEHATGRRQLRMGQGGLQVLATEKPAPRDPKTAVKTVKKKKAASKKKSGR
jgi:circadian clock protein KaiC